MEDNKLSPKVTKYLYLLISFCFLACHIDLGIFAVSTDVMRRYLNISASEMGLLASSIYFGNVAGSLITPFLFGKLKAKHIIVVSAIGNGILVSAFIIT